MRIEDLEKPAKPGVCEQMLRDLDWLGFNWDEGPDLTLADHGPHAPYTQTRRRACYRSIFERLRSKGLIYPCVCSRAEIAASQSAPHEGECEPRYPGTCRGRFGNAKEAEAFAGRAPAWRLKVPDEGLVFEDLLYGPQCINVQAGVGDFVVFKSPEQPAYQLAVVADDIAMGITEVVRGDDLIPSTARQLLLYRYLEAPPPVYGHAPLVVGPDGRRLAKRHGDSRIASLREAGVSPNQIIGTLANWSGIDTRDGSMPAEWTARWNWNQLNKERIILEPHMLQELEQD